MENKTAPCSRKLKKKGLERRLIYSVEALLFNGSGRLREELLQIAEDYGVTEGTLRNIIKKANRRKDNNRKGKRRSDHRSTKKRSGHPTDNHHLFS